jgi:Carboxypeptidase regulatory-like domain/TonB dependent receptor
MTCSRPPARTPVSVRVGKFSVVALLLIVLALAPGSSAQSESASLSGTIVDRSGGLIPDAEVTVVNVDTNVTFEAKTNDAGVYSFSFLKPGHYRILVAKQGFKQIDLRDVTLNVQDSVNRNFTLEVGGTSETIVVNASDVNINTTDATVSTVVDRNFAENLPMNGRSFQTLIQLTPGVVLTASNPSDNGQFSVNGQRAASNYWTVDGVSANIGVGASPSPFALPGNGLAGTIGSFSALGGTNSLVSVDAMQEFRIQTSTYAPEFGRTPGGQISIVTRSGTNQFHGTAFDYVRNDIFDASNWFNGYLNNPPLPKAKERQNDFGGTLGGPLLKDRTFFFFSYEGLRLRLPETELTTVPDMQARKSAAPAMQPYLNAFPIPNGPDDIATGIAQFNASYSNPASLDAYSIRIDHRFGDKVSVFGRYNYSPSSLAQRGEAPYYSLSTVSTTKITTQTATLGATWAISARMDNDLRFNYSRTTGNSYGQVDDFGGAVPLTTWAFPEAYTPQNSLLNLQIFSLLQGALATGPFGLNRQQQINLVEGFSFQEGPHSLKFGIDFRRLSPLNAPNAYEQLGYFADVPSFETGSLLESSVGSNLSTTFLFRNLGLYAQDTWRVGRRLTLTYGLRWDVDFVPQSLSGPSIPAVTGFNLDDLSNLALAAPGTTPYKTSYGDVAPRVGLAYRLSGNQDWQTVVRGGFGVFYDLATSEVGNNIGTGSYPFGGVAYNLGGTFPLPSAMATPPPISPANLSSGVLFAFDPNLKQPYTLEWNVAVEQSLGTQQAISASYIGAAGRQLLQTAFGVLTNPNISAAQLVTNMGNSDYDALQLQFQRRLSRGLQALASYTWSHSIDTGSAGSGAVISNQLLPAAISANRASSDFDIRHAVSAGVTYNVPDPETNPIARTILGGWSVDTFLMARSAPPVDITDALFGQFDNGLFGDTRPDLVPGQSFYLYGSQYPGGKAFNPAAFINPPADANGFPVGQGTTPRNFLRGFGAAQWDFAVHRDFPIREVLKLQFRAEMFNVLNHPNFGQPSGEFGAAGFGLSSQMLGQSLNSRNLGGGAFSPLYQIGGPRSIQLALKLTF